MLPRNASSNPSNRIPVNAILLRKIAHSLPRDKAAKARVREAKAEARKEEDRKLLRKFLIGPEAYEKRVRAALIKTEERKRRFGHPNRRGRQAQAPP